MHGKRAEREPITGIYTLTR